MTERCSDVDDDVGDGLDNLTSSGADTAASLISVARPFDGTRIEEVRCNVPTHIVFNIPLYGDEKNLLLEQAGARSIEGLLDKLDQFAEDEDMEINKQPDESGDYLVVTISRTEGVKYRKNLETENGYFLSGIGKNFCSIYFLNTGESLPPRSASNPPDCRTSQRPRNVV
jgi:hypothetical protein